MILHDTPPEAVFREMYGELEKVDFALRKRNNQITSRVHLTTNTRFPVILSQEYTVPSSRNRYLLWHYGQRFGDRVQWEHGAVLLLTDDRGRLQTVSLFKTTTMRESYDGLLKKIHYWSLNFTTGHLYSRYKERAMAGKELTPTETIVTWLGRNTGIFKHLEPDQIVRMPEKYRNSKPMQTNDGIILGESSSIPTPDSLECEVNIQKTFLSLSMLKEDQKEGAEDAELVRTMNELYKGQHNLPMNPF